MYKMAPKKAAVADVKTEAKKPVETKAALVCISQLKYALRL